MEYPSNSNSARKPVPSGEDKAKEKEKVVLKVVEGGAIRRKQPMGARIKESLFGKDARESVLNAIQNVAIPAAKDLAVNTLITMVSRAVYGEDAPRRNSTVTRLVGTALGHTEYDRFAKPGRRNNEPTRMTRMARVRHDFDEVILPTYSAADQVLDVMRDLIERYGAVTVGDLYDMIDEPRTHADEKWGWSGDDLRRVRPRRVAAGFLLDLPRPEELTIR
jgi:hypothetical protein